MPYGDTREQTLPITYHLTGEDAIVQSSWWRREFALYSLDANGNEVLWDMTGFLASCQIRATADSPIILEVTPFYGRSGAGVFGVAPDQYNIWMELQDGDTMQAGVRAALESMGLGYWQMDVIDLSGRVHRCYEGNVTLSRTVTY